MKYIFEGRVYESPKLTLVHWGDLGKGSDTTLGRISQGTPGHGHFGTGTYCLSMTNEYVSEGRPKYVIYASGYRLLKLTDFRKAYKLHGLLAQVNYSVNYDTNIDLSVLADKISELLQPITLDELTKIVTDCRRVFNTMSMEDSASTRVIKFLGYGGVDVSTISEMDNTVYGSVIYDLDPSDAHRA